MTKYKTEIKWAIIFIAVQLLWMLMERLLGWHDEHLDKHHILTLIFIAPALIVYFMALKEKRNKDYSGKMTWKQGFVSGLIMTLVITLITPLSQYIVQNYITPDYFANIIQYSVENNMMKQEAAEAYFNGTNYIKQATIGALMMGIVTSAIIALVVKRK